MSTVERNRKLKQRIFGPESAGWWGNSCRKERDLCLRLPPAHSCPARRERGKTIPWSHFPLPFHCPTYSEVNSEGSLEEHRVGENGEWLESSHKLTSMVGSCLFRACHVINTQKQNKTKAQYLLFSDDICPFHCHCVSSYRRKKNGKLWSYDAFPFPRSVWRISTLLETVLK